MQEADNRYFIHDWLISLHLHMTPPNHSDLKQKVYFLMMLLVNHGLQGNLLLGVTHKPRLRVATLLERVH